MNSISRLLKRGISLLLILSLVACLLPPALTTPAEAVGCYCESTWGESPWSCYFTLDNDVRVTYFAYYDENDKFQYADIRSIYLYGATEVSFDQEVPFTKPVAICKEVFMKSDRPLVTSIVIPKTISIIREKAFAGCTSLAYINLDGSVQTIEKQAFKDCTVLDQVRFAHSLTSIGDNAFQSSGVTSLTLPFRLATVGNGAFQDCAGLKEVWILNRDTVFGSDVFAGTSEELVIHGYAGSTAQAYAQEHNITFAEIGEDFKILSAAVQTPDGTIHYDGFSVVWYNPDGSVLSTQNPVMGADGTKTYTYEVTLGGNLAMNYKNPERGTVKSEDQDEQVIILEPVPMLNVTGKITDDKGSALADASVTLEHVASGGKQTATTGEDGSFSLEFPAVDAWLTLKKDGYYSTRTLLALSKAPETGYDLGSAVLHPVISDRIELNVTKQLATEEGSADASQKVTDLRNLQVKIARKNGTAVTGFEVQGTSVIFLPNAVSANETLTISVTDTTGSTVASQAVTVTLDESKMGEAAFTLTEKGSLILTGISGDTATVNLFNSSGKNIWIDQAKNSMQSAPLDEGTYTLVLIQTTDLLNAIPNLSYLDSLGLTAGTDYLKKEVTVENGRILKVTDCKAPTLDVSKLVYTVQTSATINKTGSLAVGELFLLRLEYALEANTPVSAQSIQVVLPEGINLTEEKIALLNDKPVFYTYDATTRTATVDVTGKTAAVVHLYCQIGAQPGDFIINSSLAFSGGGTQPLGTAVAQVYSSVLTVPDRTCKDTIVASGKTVPMAEVFLYDNDILAAQTKANLVGDWSVELPLTGDLGEYSYHYIHAEIKVETLEERSLTDRSLVVYDKRVSSLDTITMRNGSRVAVFDFNDASLKTPSFSYIPGMPTYTYEVRFQGADIPESAYVVTEDRFGTLTYVDLTYDATIDAWIGSHNYTAEPPVSIGAACQQEALPLPEDDGFKEEMVGYMIDYANELQSVMSAAFNDGFEGTYDEQTHTGQIIYTDPETGEETLFATTSDSTTVLTEPVDTKELEATQYIPLDDEGTLWIRPETREGVVAWRMIDLSAGEMYYQSYEFNTEVNARKTAKSGWWESWDWADTAAAIGTAAATLTNFAVPGVTIGAGIFAYPSWNTAKRCWNARTGANGEMLDNSMMNLKAMAEAKCKENGGLGSSSAGSLDSRIKGLESKIIDYHNASKSHFGTDTTTTVSGAIGVGSMATTLIEGLKWPGRAAGGLGLVAIGVTKYVSHKEIQENEKMYNDIQQEIDALQKEIIGSQIAGGSNFCGDDPRSVPPLKPTNLLYDPSGYVYEAVPSNRIQGVTATVYYKDEDGQPVAWDAENYSQINPQITGTDGAYHWDVPLGEWKVCFEKEGYLPGDTSKVPQANESGWLPVLPPQLNINVGLISTAAPTVKSAAAFTERLELEFSQYMNIESVYDALSLTRGGKAVKVAVMPLNAEYDLEQVNQYATRFAVLPVDGNTKGQLVLSVSTKAKNYAGTALQKSYTSEPLVAEELPTDLTAPENIAIGTGKEYSLSVTLEKSLPNRVLQVTNETQDMVEVMTSEVITDENGRAVITLKGIYPGIGRVTVTEPKSGLSRTIWINTATSEEIETIQSVIATLEDGTPVTNGMSVDVGTKIYLSTGTEGAEIRYTLNNTCPCTADALTYSGPIVVKQDMMLRAAAHKDGAYGATIKVKLKAKANIVEEPETLQNVIFTLEDGTPVTNGMSVDIGAKIYLSTGTKGAQIRYTLNDTSPSTKDALTYSGPIVVKKDMVLRAVAYKDGKYSATIKVKLKATMSLADWDVNHDGKLNIGDVAKLYASVKKVIKLDKQYNVGDVARLYSYIKRNK